MRTWSVYDEAWNFIISFEGFGLNDAMAHFLAFNPEFNEGNYHIVEAK